jgi:pseudouridine synthase, rluA family
MKIAKQKKIKSSEDGLLVKNILSKQMGFSRREISRFHVSGSIYLNDEKCRLTQEVHTNDIVTVRTEEQPQLESKPIILYEDDDIVVVNKPAGIPSHASAEHFDDDMGSILKRYYQDDNFTVRTVGRLDKGVSGIVVYAKTKQMAALLASAREGQLLHKEYLAIVKGKFEEQRDTLKYTLGKEKGIRGRSVTVDGQKCITNYEVITEGNFFSLIKVHIETGRLHQIRAGMAHFGHPLIGDRLYGGSMHAMKRPALHCWKVEFVHPKTKKKITIECRLPDDMQKVVNKLQEISTAATGL